MFLFLFSMWYLVFHCFLELFMGLTFNYFRLLDHHLALASDSLSHLIINDVLISITAFNIRFASCLQDHVFTLLVFRSWVRSRSIVTGVSFSNFNSHFIVQEKALIDGLSHLVTIWSFWVKFNMLTFVFLVIQSF